MRYIVVANSGDQQAVSGLLALACGVVHNYVVATEEHLKSLVSVFRRVGTQ